MNLDHSISGVLFPKMLRNNNLCCPSCKSKNISVFHEATNFPVHSIINIPSRSKALSYPRGDIALYFCHECAFVFNSAFEPSILEYCANCEETQGFSRTFREFARRQATELVERYQLYEKTIIEIGCGKGEFLSLLCDIGNNYGLGFDPAYVPGRNEPLNKGNVTFISDYYSQKYGDKSADFICCKMTLEHIADPLEFLQVVRRSIGSRLETIVFFQVPDATRIIRDCCFEDIYYEHCSYFSPGSLVRVFFAADFKVLDVRLEYNQQYIVIEARPGSGASQCRLPLCDDLKLMENFVANFKAKFLSKVEEWEAYYQRSKATNKRVVIWGSGSKAVACLAAFKNIAIDYVVDINPHRQGNFMPGTGQKIVSPEFLKDYCPHAVVIMNPVYEQEIRADLERLCISPDVLTL
jgi:hypothetical protein